MLYYAVAGYSPAVAAAASAAVHQPVLQLPHLFERHLHGLTRLNVEVHGAVGS
jgi:hypothetical protein